MIGNINAEERKNRLEWIKAKADELRAQQKSGHIIKLEDILELIKQAKQYNDDLPQETRSMISEIRKTQLFQSKHQIDILHAALASQELEHEEEELIKQDLEFHEHLYMELRKRRHDMQIAEDIEQEYELHKHEHDLKHPKEKAQAKKADEKAAKGLQKSATEQHSHETSPSTTQDIPNQKFDSLKTYHAQPRAQVPLSTPKKPESSDKSPKNSQGGNHPQTPSPHNHK